MNHKFLILLTLFLLPIANAATTGNISTATVQNSTAVVTGVWGSSYIFYCNSASTCQPGDKCILDYDDNSANFSGTAYKGWCVPSSETRCRHENTFTASGGKLCDGGARSCSSSAWTTTTCSANQTCTNGDCVASSSASSTGSGGGGASSGNATTTTIITTLPKSSEISITSVPDDFGIVQGGSALKNVTVKNIGNISLSSVSLVLSGIDWYAVMPSGTNISKDLSFTFTINFTAPENAEVKEYEVTVTAKNDTISVSRSFKIRVLPSNATVESVIIPLYNEYISNISNLENRLAELKSKGADVTELQNVLNTIKDKLNQANSSLSSQDYFTANVLLNDIKQLVRDFEAKAAEAKTSEFKIDIIYIIVPVAVGIIAVLAYLFWPTKK